MVLGSCCAQGALALGSSSARPPPRPMLDSICSSGLMLGSCWTHLGSWRAHVGLIWAHVGLMLGSCWAHLGSCYTHLGSCWTHLAHVGLMLGSLGSRWTHLGSCWAHASGHQLPGADVTEVVTTASAVATKKAGRVKLTLASKSARAFAQLQLLPPANTRTQKTLAPVLSRPSMQA